MWILIFVTTFAITIIYKYQFICRYKYTDTITIDLRNVKKIIYTVVELTEEHNSMLHIFTKYECNAS